MGRRNNDGLEKSSICCEAVTGIILAGGKSSRMGRNKALLDFGGRSIIEHTVDLFKSIFPEVILVTNTPEEYANLGIKTVTDIFPGKGSLGGIYTGLIHSSHDYSFIASCDMPFLRRELIEFLINLNEGYDAVVPRLKDGYEPLHALYSKRCIKPIESMIKKGDLRIIGFYPEVTVREVSEEELAPFNPEPSSFININTPEEYEEAVRGPLNKLKNIIMNKTKYTVPPEDGGKRLDLFLTLKHPSLTRSQIQRLIEEGLVKVNKKQAKASHKIREAEEIEIDIPEPEAIEALPEPIPLDILYEDSDVVVINKPAKLVVHPAAGNYTGTLVNALLYHCKDLSGIGGKLRPGIVHRLDKDTTGVLIAAKSDKAHQSLAGQFKKHSIKRKYIALVHGVIKGEKGKIEAEIGRHQIQRKMMSVKTKRGKTAVTHFKVLSRFDQFTLVELTLETGRTHQIRVHLSSINHPVVGDQVYGGKERISGVKEPKIRKVIKKLGRQALHATILGFIHPETNKYMEFTAPIPEDFQTVLDALAMS